MKYFRFVHLPIACCVIEHWDKSREKAQELRFDQWGTLDEVNAMATPLRQVNTRRAAMDCLKEIAQNNPFISRSGLSAWLPKRSLGKIVSYAAVSSSFLPASALSRGGKYR